jgi:hypothetical protein
MKTKVKAKRPARKNGAKSDREQVLAKILAMIQRKPGIRPSEINRRLNVVQTDELRDVLIRRGLVRKVKTGGETHLYPR